MKCHNLQNKTKTSPVMRHAPLLFLLLLPNFLFAQGIKGTIVDSQKEPVAYANIYVPELKTGTSSNINGEFELKLPSGEWDVLFQYIGYQSVTQHLKIADDFKQLNVVLQAQNVRLSEIKVLASGEDPAYYVMRHAIAMAPYYDKQVSQYDCKVYLKGTGVVYKVPGLFKKRLEKEGIKKDEAFVLEQLNKIHFEQPDKLNQEVIAMRSSGESNNTDPMQMITTNLYNVDEYGIVSPVSRQALKTYRFQLVGVFEDQGRTINKVKVTPKVKEKGTFSGIINIVDGFWNIHSADLKFSMPMVDVDMRQLYSLVDENTWMPTSFDFKMDVSALGFGLTYDYVASVSDYEVELNSQLDHSLFDEQVQLANQEAMLTDSLSSSQSVVEEVAVPLSRNQQKINEMLSQDDLSNREMYKLERLMDKETQRSMPPEPLEITDPIKVSRDAVQNDSAYWSELRPIPLTTQESTEFGKKDSIVAVQSTPEYQDSIQAARTKFKFSDLLLGRTYRYGNDSTLHQSSLSVSGLINLEGITFTTVDGFAYELPFSFYSSDTLGHSFYAGTSVRYAFSRKTLYADGKLRYRLNGLKQQWLGLKGGRTLEDFKGSKGISNMEYSIYSLLMERNDPKFYENRFINFNGSTEITNGFNLRAELEFAERLPVRNSSSYTFIDYDHRAYTDNIPDISGTEDWQLGQSKSASVALGLTYTPRKRYRIRNQVKYPASSDYPTFELNYKKGLQNLFNSDVDYDILQLGIQQSLSIGFNDQLSYNIRAGKYLNRNRLYAADFDYVQSNEEWLTLANPDKLFALPNYYALYSRNHFVEAHTSFAFDKLLLTRLPILNQTLIGEKVKLHYYNSESSRHYFEFTYGLTDVFLLFDLEFNWGLTDWNHRVSGFKLSMKLQ